MSAVALVEESSKFEKALIENDLAKLTSAERLSFYKAVCESLKLNWLTMPFAYIFLNGKLTLYALKACAEQLRQIHGVSLSIVSRELIGDVYVVTARAKDKHGREDESTGAVFVGGLRGDALANAYMKTETKGKRRVTLSICGLGLLDESEVDSIKGARVISPDKVDEELEKMKREEAEQKANPPPPKPGPKANNPFEPSNVSPEEYVVRFGALNTKKLSEVNADQLRNYVERLDAHYEESGQEPPPAVKEFFEMVTRYFEPAINVESLPVTDDELERF